MAAWPPSPNARLSNTKNQPVQLAPEPRSRGGPRKRWRDVICADLKDRNISEEVWYNEAATSRAVWRATYRQACADTNYREQHQEHAAHQVQCLKCQRTFRRECDMKRHKCLSERRKPVSEQRGAVQCPTGKRWFCSRGGL